jgi:hypothetical protein
MKRSGPRSGIGDGRVTVEHEFFKRDLALFVCISSRLSHGTLRRGLSVEPGWSDADEFRAVQVENVYRSENGLTKIRESHDDDKVIWDDTEKLLKRKEIKPPVKLLLDSFERDEPDVFQQHAQVKATYNPFRDKEEQNKNGNAPAAAP